MRFSWKAILFAPLAIALIFAFVFSMAPAQNQIFSFALFAGIGSAFSYGITVGLFLPALYLTSIFKKLTTPITIALGALVAGISYFPCEWIIYASTGNNSGHPIETFGDYLRSNGSTEPLLFLFGGIVTATLYALLTKTPS